MKQINEIVHDLLTDKAVLNFELKSIKEGLVIVKTNFLPLGFKVEIVAVNTQGEEFLILVKDANKEERNSLIVSLFKQDLSHEELAMLFSLTKSSISIILKSKKV